MFKHIFEFSGRSVRLEYFVHSIADVFGILAVVFAVSFIEGQLGTSVSEEVVVFSMFGVIFIGAVAEIAVTVRRFHDLGMSGWYLLGTMVPFYNIYLGLILLFKKGDAQDNNYGPGHV